MRGGFWKRHVCDMEMGAVLLAGIEVTAKAVESHAWQVAVERWAEGWQAEGPPHFGSGAIRVRNSRAGHARPLRAE